MFRVFLKQCDDHWMLPQLLEMFVLPRWLHCKTRRCGVLEKVSSIAYSSCLSLFDRDWLVGSGCFVFIKGFVGQRPLGTPLWSSVFEAQPMKCANWTGIKEMPPTRKFVPTGILWVYEILVDFVGVLPKIRIDFRTHNQESTYEQT